MNTQSLFIWLFIQRISTFFFRSVGPYINLPFLFPLNYPNYNILPRKYYLSLSILNRPHSAIQTSTTVTRFPKSNHPHTRHSSYCATLPYPSGIFIIIRATNELHLAFPLPASISFYPSASPLKFHFSYPHIKIQIRQRCLLSCNNRTPTLTVILPCRPQPYLALSSLPRVQDSSPPPQVPSILNCLSLALM